MNKTLCVLLTTLWLAAGPDDAPGTLGRIVIRLDRDASPRVRFGAQHLSDALREIGYEPITTVGRDQVSPLVVVGVDRRDGRTEDYRLLRRGNNEIRVTGFGDSGALYGCLELSRRIIDGESLPGELDVTDGPAFRLRGPCVAMQLTTILPGRDTYEYPYTPEHFPFFYDRVQWIEYLDFLVANRFNTLYLWNGHPFASLVKLPEYPYALEVPEEIYRRNVEMYRFVTEEADKRGIWVVQMFYNIFVSQPFAEHHAIATQHRMPTKLVSDYNRKSIAKFVETYPNVGLLVCLGEALRGQENQERWMNETVIEGVKDAMQRLGMTEEPPIVVRAHSVSDAKALMESALKRYKNLYTMVKYNGESLTTYEPRGAGQQVHLDLSRLGSTHVVNVHILANLEPFRYGATEFIRQSVLACRDRLGAQGLHLYPLAYWDWPHTPDQGDADQKQYERDWIWFEAWARYLWQPQRDRQADHRYWVGRLTETFGNEQAAELILSAYNDAGNCAPMLLRRFGITEGNRQTLALGMFLDQLVNPQAYGPFNGLWEWQSPPGERLQDYAGKEWAGQEHEGETPPSVIEDVSRFAARAAEAIERAAPLVTKNRDEFERFYNDVHCIQLMSENYAQKVRAAMLVLRYGYSRDKRDMQAAAVHLEKSLEIYRALADRTAGTYRYANTLQTSHRRIPIRCWKDNGPYHYHWRHMLSLYEEELAQFKQRVAGIE